MVVLCCLWSRGHFIWIKQVISKPRARCLVAIKPQNKARGNLRRFEHAVERATTVLQLFTQRHRDDYWTPKCIATSCKFCSIPQLPRMCLQMANGDLDFRKERNTCSAWCLCSVLTMDGGAWELGGEKKNLFRHQASKICIPYKWNTNSVLKNIQI